MKLDLGERIIAAGNADQLARRLMRDIQSTVTREIFFNEFKAVDEFYESLANSTRTFHGDAHELELQYGTYGRCPNVWTTAKAAP